MKMDPIIPELINAFSKHLVGLHINYQPISKEISSDNSRSYLYSGFLLLVRDILLWVSAGHVLEEIEDLFEYQQDGLIQQLKLRLIDGIVFEKKFLEPIPLIFHKTRSYYEYLQDIRIDFGIYKLDLLSRKTLEEKGMIPFSKGRKISKEINNFFLVGFPNELIFYIGTTIKIEPSLIKVTPIIESDESPSKFPQDRKLAFKLPEDCDLENIKGMSGGPIIGIRDNKIHPHTLIGLQSTWDVDKRIIKVTPASLFLPIIENSHICIGSKPMRQNRVEK